MDQDAIATLHSEIKQKDEEFKKTKEELTKTEMTLEVVQRLIPHETSQKLGDVLGQEWAMEKTVHDIVLSFMCLTGEVKRNERERAKETLSRLDRLIYETYAGQETKMTDIRKSMTPLINNTIKEWFLIQWPPPGAALDKNKHKPDSEAGNKIKIAKSFVLCDPSGQTLIPARVETMS